MAWAAAAFVDLSGLFAGLSDVLVAGAGRLTLASSAAAWACFRSIHCQPVERNYHPVLRTLLGQSFPLVHLKFLW